jgi:hypothetical protein
MKMSCSGYPSSCVEQRPRLLEALLADASIEGARASRAGSFRTIQEPGKSSRFRFA